MLEQLKHRECELLNSYQSHFIEYGRALKVLISKMEAFAGDRLSEEVLLSDCARDYIREETKKYIATKREEHQLHIKLASEYLLKEFLLEEEIVNLLKEKLTKFTFTEAKNILCNLPEYSKIRPEDLKKVLIKLKIEG